MNWLVEMELEDKRLDNFIFDTWENEKREPMINIEKLDPKGPYSFTNIQINFGKNAFIHFYNDWEQFAFWRKDVKWNWFTFTFFHFEIENDKMVPGYEIEFALLGLGIRFRYNRDWKKEPTETTKSLDDLMKKRSVMLYWKNGKSKKTVEKEYQRLLKKIKEYKKENLKDIAVIAQ